MDSRPPLLISVENGRRADVQVLVGHGPHEVLEGPPLEGVVVLAFSTAAAAKDWYVGDAHQEAARHRFDGATYRAVLVEGTDQQ